MSWFDIYSEHTIYTVKNSHMRNNNLRFGSRFCWIQKQIVFSNYKKIIMQFQVVFLPQLFA
jgi:hypothetical protein